MPLTARVIPPALDLQSRPLDLRSVHPEEVLDNVVSRQLAGVLSQLGRLTQCAGEIFSRIQGELISSGDRIARVVARTRKVGSLAAAAAAADVARSLALSLSLCPSPSPSPRLSLRWSR